MVMDTAEHACVVAHSRPSHACCCRHPPPPPCRYLQDGYSSRRAQRAGRQAMDVSLQASIDQGH